MYIYVNKDYNIYNINKKENKSEKIKHEAWRLARLGYGLYISLGYKLQGIENLTKIL